MTTAIPLLGWTLFTGVCAIPVFKGTKMLAEWLEERPDGSVVQGSSNSLVPVMSSLLAFGALAYGLGFGGVAGIAGGATTGSEAQSFSPPNTPTIDIAVFAETNDSLYWLGSAFSADPGDTHDSTQVQIDTIGTNNWSGSTTYTDSVYLASERDTVPPVSNSGRALQADAVKKARLRYYGREGGWSAWSDSIQFTMSQYAVPNAPSVDVVVFSATNDSMFWLGTEFNASQSGDSHQQTQVQIDSANGDWTSPAFTDATTSALERDTLPPVSGLALPAFNTGDSLGTRLKARIRYRGEGGWSAWSDSTTFRMRRTFETTSVTPYINIDFEPYETIAQMDTTTAVWNVNETSNGGLSPDPAIIDTTSGYNGRRHSMRYAFARTDSAVSITITRTLKNFAANQTEIWVEIPVRHSTDFDTYCGLSTGSGDPITWPSPGLACGPGDHKLVFGGTTQGNTYRWQYKVGAGGLSPSGSGRAAGRNQERPIADSLGYTWNNENNFQPNTLDYFGCDASARGYDVCGIRDMWRAGEWNVLRMHWKHSVPANPGHNGAQEY